MLKRLLILHALFLLSNSSISQNLVVNPGAESTPLGTGWTIVAAGTMTCSQAAATYVKWTMVPDGSDIYPAAHGGTHIFFPGCNGTVVPGMVYELRQNIDVSADAAAIDGGFVTYIFDGFIQTPVANPTAQADAGRFVVDYLDASNAVIGTSYTSVYQSRAVLNTTSWQEYTNSRLSPAGTRTVRIRLQATLTTGPAINVYFDDISLTRNSTLPVSLLSFSAKNNPGSVVLNWSISDAVNFNRFEIEKSTDASLFSPIGTVYYQPDQVSYNFQDSASGSRPQLFYRLKMIDLDGRFSYSPVLLVNRDDSQSGLHISPNPATSSITVSGLESHGELIIRNMSGGLIRKVPVNAGSMIFPLDDMPKGIYLLTYDDGKGISTKKLVVY